MQSLVDIKRTEVSSETYTDDKNVKHTVVHSVLCTDTNNTSADVEERIVDDLYKIFTFRPRGKKS